VIHVADGISVPVRPLVGCIGTAPRAPEAIRNIKQGPFGGNMDCPEIGVGVTVHLLSENEGGLVYFGDCKAISASGELVAPPEVGTILTLSMQVIKRPSVMGWPRFERNDALFTLATERDSSIAQKTAMREMLLWLEDETGAPKTTIARLLGMLGNASPCQTMGVLHTAHVSFPRSYYEKLKKIGGRG
jgi:acetamidase/formamidase